VAAGVAAQGRQAEQSSGEGERAGDVFGGDALKVGVATVAAVGVERQAEGYRAGVETRFASFTAPGEDFRAAEKIVHYRASLGAANIGGVAERARDGQGRAVLLPTG
jgi:hypothetical protein